RPSRWSRKTPPDRVTITACSPHTSNSARPDATTSVAVSVQRSYAHCLATTTTTSATSRSGRGLLRHTGAVRRTRRIHGLGLARVTHRAAEQERLTGRTEQDPFTINGMRGHADHPRVVTSGRT